MPDPDVAIADRNELATTPARALALDCLEAGIAAALPGRVVPAAVSLDGDDLRIADSTVDLTEFDEVLVLGGGKASVGMAAALYDCLGDRIDGGIVITDAEGESVQETDCGPVRVARASHPIPDDRGVEATRELLALADDADERTLVLALLSGGGSALLPAPAGDITLDDLQRVTDALLDAGAAIAEVNAVRKHCSAIKGGLLARRAAPATVHALAISDVVGDDPSTIASGPTVPDPTTFADAQDVLDRYGIDPPERVADRLAAGARGEIPETPAAGDPVFDRTSYHLLASGRTAVDAARAVAVDRGYETLVLSTRIRGEAREAAKTHAAVAEEVLAAGEPVAPPAVVLSGGEVTVTVDDGAGRSDDPTAADDASTRGGPSGEFALSAAIELRETTGDGVEDDGGAIALSAVDTDGRDGPGVDDGADSTPERRGGPVAGAIVDPGTVDDRRAARRALAAHDAHGYLDGCDALVRTGLTGTNVNDLRVIVIPAVE